MATPKKLIKELILISGLRGLSILSFIKRILCLSDAATANPTIAPNLDPTPAVIQAKADAVTLMLSERAALLVAYKAKTERINAAISELLKLINNKWAPQAQKAVAGNLKLAKLLAWYIKGIYTGEAPANALVGSALDSYPGITKIDSSDHLQHKVFTRNSANGMQGVPKDAKSIEIYQQIGGDAPPTDIKKMSHMGPAFRGNFKTTSKAADISKTVYYIAVYFGKKSKTALIQSPVRSAAIN